MRLVIFTLALLLSQKYFAGCGDLILKTSNGILITNGSADGNVVVNTVSITSEDSVMISVIRGSGCSANVRQIWLNGEMQDHTPIPKFYSAGPNRVKILGKPGKYIVFTDYGTVSFEFIMKTAEQGCGPLLCNTSNGINVTPTGEYLGTIDVDTISVSQIDSMTVTLRGPQCGVSAPTISINGIQQSYLTPFCWYC